MRKIAPALRRSIFHGYYLWEQKCLDLQKKKSAVLHLRNGRFYMNILRFIITSALNNAYSKNQKQKVFIINLLMNGYQRFKSFLICKFIKIQYNKIDKYNAQMA